MTKAKRDYSHLRYAGIDKSFSASQFHGDSVLLFEKPRAKYSLASILYTPDLIRVPVSEFDRELRELGEKISDIRHSSKYKNTINSDTAKYREACEQLVVMQAIVEEVKGVRTSFEAMRSQEALQ